MNNETFDKLSRPFQPHFLETDVTAVSIQIAATLYKRMARRLQEALEELGPAADHFLPMIHTVSQSAVRHMEQSIKPGTVVVPMLPLITEEGVKRWIGDLESRLKGLDKPQRQILTIFALAGYCYETRVLWSIDETLWDSRVQPFTIDFSTALESYGFWKTIERRDIDGFDMFGTRRAMESFVSDQTKRIDQSLINLGSTTLEMQNLFMSTREETSKFLSDTKEEIESLRKNAEDIQAGTRGNQDRLESIVKAMDLTDGQVEAFAASVREELKIDTTKNLWKDRAFWNATSFWISAVVVACAIVTPPWWAIVHLETVIQFLKRVGDAATQGLPSDATAAQLTAATISRLVIISAPLGLYFWAIKLLVRFNTRSMVLMDDARQRHTTMDTYFHLIERSGATTEERGLMLNALFRPLPGQGQENIEPPNFMELVKKPE